MAASKARLRLTHQIDVRNKIRATQLINRLQNYVDGEVSLEPGQVTAIKVLLGKVLPDLMAVSGDPGGAPIKHEVLQVKFK